MPSRWQKCTPLLPTRSSFLRESFQIFYHSTAPLKLYTRLICFNFEKLENFVELAIVVGYFSKIRIIWSTKTYLVPCQTSLMKLLAKVVNVFEKASSSLFCRVLNIPLEYIEITTSTTTVSLKLFMNVSRFHLCICLFTDFCVLLCGSSKLS